MSQQKEATEFEHGLKTFEELEVHLTDLNDYWTQDHGDEEVVRVYMVRWSKKKQKEDFIELPRGWKRVFVPGEKFLQVIDYDPRRVMVIDHPKVVYEAIKKRLPKFDLFQSRLMAKALGHGDFSARGVVKHKDGRSFEIYMITGKPFAPKPW